MTQNPHRPSSDSGESATPMHNWADLQDVVPQSLPSAVRSGSTQGAVRATAALDLNTDNPWLSLGIMNAIEGGALMESWQQMLTLQTHLFGPIEVRWLMEQGFGSSGRGVLEVGSASGYYGAYLARNFPHVRLYGIEANPHFIERAVRGAEWPPNYSIAPCKLGEDALPSEIATQIDQCLARYVLQHVSNPLRVLRAIHATLPPGGRLFIIEEDDFFFTSYPSWRPFDSAVDAWRRVVSAGGSDSKIGRKLPNLLAEAGFRVDRFELALRTNGELGTGLPEFLPITTKLFHYTNPSLVSAAAALAVEQGFHSESAGHEQRVVATYPHVLVAATK